jgi:hypothetical protein
MQAQKEYELMFKRYSKHFLGWKKASGPDRDPVSLFPFSEHEIIYSHPDGKREVKFFFEQNS